MSSTLQMLLPTTFPSARSAWPERAEPTLTASSGALVPKATTVKPMTSGEMPARGGQTSGTPHQPLGPQHQQCESDYESDQDQGFHGE